jgi:hypothetical protein
VHPGQAEADVDARVLEQVDDQLGAGGHAADPLTACRASVGGLHGRRAGVERGRDACGPAGCGRSGRPPRRRGGPAGNGRSGGSCS